MFLILLLALDFHLAAKPLRRKPTSPFFREESDIELIHNGEDLCERLLDDIRQAESSVHVMFIL
ncbi:hypothetical protein PO124_05345 [Bacillus licheniformis]|nr:hypothetical protein [Bacillus licheniformis]